MASFAWQSNKAVLSASPKTLGSLEASGGCFLDLSGVCWNQGERSALVSLLHLLTHLLQVLPTLINGAKIYLSGVPVVAQWLTNPTRNHEVAGSVPAVAQWVNDLVLL